MAPIQIQWQKLILNPLVKLQDEGLTKPIVFVLDGLDERDEQDRGEILSVEIQYACLYWVRHSKPTGRRIHDDDDAYSFLPVDVI